MLYTKIRYCDAIRKLYRLRNIMVHERHRDISSRLGYQKYSKYYYDLLEKLMDEKVLDRNNVFIDNMPNSWLTELPKILSKEQTKILGNYIPFAIYLALFFDIVKSPRSLHDELKFTRSSTYYAIDKLKELNLIKTEKSEVIVAKKSKFYEWLFRYLELTLVHADVKNEISILFDSAPAFMDGPHAYYIVNYEPGRPIGPSDMIIRTHKPYMEFWRVVLKNVRYFKEYPKRIKLLTIQKEEKIVWINSLPYNKNAKEGD